VHNAEFKVESVGRGLAPALKKGNGLPRLLRRLAMTDQCHSEQSEESVLLKRIPGGQAFPEGKVDFLQLVAEKTKEGLPRTGRAGSLMQRELSKIFDF